MRQVTTFWGLIALLVFALPLHALTFRLPEEGGSLVGDPMIYRARYEDTFLKIAKVYGLGFTEMIEANPGMNPWVPGEEAEITLPLSFLLPDAPADGVVLNLAELRLYYYLPDGETVLTYPVGIGRQGWATPLMTTRVTGKIANPSWTPPDSIRAEHAAEGDILPPIVPPGPDNPLGAYAIQLAEPGYFLHGSNRSMGVGMRVSHGCIRLYDGDIEELARRLPKGTPVRIVNQPIKAGWDGDTLYLEVHKPLQEDENGNGHYREVLEAALEGSGDSVALNWETVERVVSESRGIPIAVGKR